MSTLYVSQQGCYVCLQQETLLIKRKNAIYGRVQLPLVEQILVFGMAQVTTQVIRSCLHRDIPIAYLSKMGYCYGRLNSIKRGYRYLSRYQQELSFVDRLTTARAIVVAKLKNSRVVLRRQLRRLESETVTQAMENLSYFASQAANAVSIESLMGYEGAGAAEYFRAFGECIRNPDFSFTARVRHPPGNEVNAMLSFGYQVVWNHLLALLELQGLDPYCGCLHEGRENHAALASDLIEEFRAPLVDSLVLRLINTKEINSQKDFVYRDGACYLNDSGRKKYLQAFIKRMEEVIHNSSGVEVPRWDWLNEQVKRYKQFVYSPSQSYQPFRLP